MPNPANGESPDIQIVESGVILSVKASPGSRKNEVRGIHSGQLKVAVTQVAEKGKANKAIIELLSRLLGIPKSSIALHSGATSSSKKFLFTNVNAEDLLKAISERT